MKELEKGRDRIQKICDVLKRETLDPAKQEAREIVENGHLQASEIIKEAKAKAQEILLSAEKEMEEKRRIFHASLQLACRQTIDLLKQKIEEELFDRSLVDIVAKEMADPQVIAKLINSLMRSMEEQGVEEDFAAVLPKEISAKSIAALLSSLALQRLESNVLNIGDFKGGVQIRLKGRKMTIDMSDEALQELIKQYVRRDFRDMIFNI